MKTFNKIITAIENTKPMKKVKDWFEELPADVRKKAFANTPEKELEYITDKLSKAIDGSFTFARSTEGFKYWDAIIIDLETQSK